MQLDRSHAAPWNALTLPHLLERGGLDLEQPAIRFEGATRTYGELRLAARKVANALSGLGIEPGERVAVLTTNRLEFTEVEVGISAARAIMVPLNWRLRAGELTNLLNRSAARAIFVEDRFLGTINELRRSGAVPELRTVIGLGREPCDLGYDELLFTAGAEPLARPGSFADPHEIIFTSGTTGRPKGVVWTDGTVMFNALQQVVDFGLGPQHSCYVVIDQYYIGGRHDFSWPILQQGGTVHVKPSSNFDAGEVLRYIAEHRITHVLWVPTMLYEILRVPDLAEHDFSALQMIMCGGQPVSVALTVTAQAAFPQTDFIQVYGLTEGGGTVTHVRPADARRKPGSAGRPSINVEMRLLDGHGEEVPQGETGEITIRAPTVTAGYWADPELTAEQLIDGWLHTGDMGFQDSDGFLFISGRKTDMIISGGMNVFPAEIEDVLREHPSVGDVAVIGLLDEKWGERVCAVIEPAAGAEIDERALIAHCTERLASYKKPTSVRVVDELPRTTAGKSQKYLLRERFSAGELLARGGSLVND